MMLYEAAQVMPLRSAKWSWLKAWAMKIARHRGMKKAIVALARLRFRNGTFNFSEKDTDGENFILARGGVYGKSKRLVKLRQFLDHV